MRWGVDWRRDLQRWGPDGFDFPLPGAEYWTRLQAWMANMRIYNVVGYAEDYRLAILYQRRAVQTACRRFEHVVAERFGRGEAAIEALTVKLGPLKERYGQGLQDDGRHVYIDLHLSRALMKYAVRTAGQWPMVPAQREVPTAVSM